MGSPSGAEEGHSWHSFWEALVGGLHPPTRSRPTLCCRRWGGGTQGGVLSPGRRRCARAAPRTGSQRAGLAAGTGWRVLRRLNLQEDILIRSCLRQRTAAAGGRTGLLPPPLPRALAGRETEVVAAVTGAPAPGRPRGAEVFESLAASCQGQSNPPTLGRRALGELGGEGRRARGGGPERAGQGRAGARPLRMLPAPFPGRCSGFPGPGEDGVRGARARGWDPRSWV